MYIFYTVLNVNIYNTLLQFAINQRTILSDVTIKYNNIMMTTKVIQYNYK